MTHFLRPVGWPPWQFTLLPCVQPTYAQTDYIHCLLGCWHLQWRLCHIHFWTCTCNDCQAVLHEFGILRTHSTRWGCPGPINPCRPLVSTWSLGKTCDSWYCCHWGSTCIWRTSRTLPDYECRDCSDTTRVCYSPLPLHMQYSPGKWLQTHTFHWGSGARAAHCIWHALCQQHLSRRVYQWVPIYNTGVNTWQ